MSLNPDFLRVQRGFLQRWEGGYVNDKDDPGGETNLGVTRNVWRGWCARMGLPVKAMRDLTRADVEPLYEALYWAPLAGELSWPLSAAIYDFSVNAGVGDGNAFDEQGREAGATWVLWRATQLAPTGTPLQKALATCDAREEFYRGIVARRPASRKFLNGWLNRTAALRVWLKENAEPLVAAVLLVPKAGGEPVPWNGKPDPFGGIILTPDLIRKLRVDYPPGGARGTYQRLYVYHRSNGQLVLERVPEPK